MTFTAGQTLTAASLNAAFDNLIPPTADLLGGASGLPVGRTVGTGLSFSSSTLLANWRLGLVTSLSNMTLVGGVLEATLSGGTVTSLATGSGLTGGPITNSGTVSLATRTASTIMGNPGTAAAVPSDIAIGSGLTLASNGTLTATGSGGSVTSIATAAPLTGGPITTTGTVALASQAASTLFGNAGTASAVPAAVAVGSGLTLAANGTISATGSGGTVTSIVAGDGLNGGTITTSGTISADWDAGPVTTLGNGAWLNSGTLSIAHQGTVTATATGTIAPVGLASCLVNIGTVAASLTVSNGSYNGQALRLEILQGATAQTVGFDASVRFGDDITSYTASTGANERDYVMLVWTGAVWDFLAVNQGFG